MTLDEARAILAGHIEIGDPRVLEAYRIMDQIREARRIIERKAELTRTKPERAKPHNFGRLSRFAPDVLEAAYQAKREQANREAARRTHPDAGGSHEAFVRVQQAKRALENEAR